jgi:hypothetical protein
VDVLLIAKLTTGKRLYVRTIVITLEGITIEKSGSKVSIQLPSNVKLASQEIVLIASEQIISAKPKLAIKTDDDWDRFEALISQYGVDTGIEDLAHQHDHYIHGTPKRELNP